MEQNIQTDVLVIGGGGAAARAAFEAHCSGAKVVLAVKGDFCAIGTRGSGATASGISPFGVFSAPGWRGTLGETEQELATMTAPALERAYSNILQVGLGMADPKLVQVMVEKAAETRARLTELGSTFGEYGMRSHGVPIMAALGSSILKAGIKVIERIMIVSLLVEAGECLGAVGIDERSGDVITIQAGATIMATGGDAGLFLENLNPSCNTGDGYVMGYNAGAELTNIEFKQVFLGTVFPTRNMLIKTLPPYVKLTNSEGEEFLEKYLPEGASLKDCLAQRDERNPFSTRDELSRYVDVAIVNEVKAGRGTKHNGVYLDRSDSRNPSLKLQRDEFFKYRGIDFSQGPVEVGVCHHSSLGGYRIDENAETTVNNLYAAGEVAAGPHGADRVGGSMLLASQVFGAIAGKKSAERVKGRKLPNISSDLINAARDRINSLRNRQGNVKTGELRKKLIGSAYFNMLVVKSEKTLTKLLNDIKNLEEEMVSSLSVTNSKELVDALEFQNLLELAKVEAHVCLTRTESRGPHYREDFPRQNDKEWVKNITVKKVNGSLQLGTVALDPKWENRGDDSIGGYWA